MGPSTQNILETPSLVGSRGQFTLSAKDPSAISARPRALPLHVDFSSKKLVRCSLADLFWRSDVPERVEQSEVVDDFAHTAHDQWQAR